jgi:hypothetical protein
MALVAASRALAPIAQTASNQLASIAATGVREPGRFAQEASGDPRSAAEAYRRLSRTDLTGLILSRWI